jgi:uncharacterized protein (DUF433 family)
VILVAEDEIMTKTIEIIERGRGPQLSDSRITVQDLVPYFQQQMNHEQILEIMPALTLDELKVVELYVQENYEAVMEQDRRIRERNASRKNSPEIEEILRRGGEKMAALREEFKKKRTQELNGDHAAG